MSGAVASLEESSPLSLAFSDCHMQEVSCALLQQPDMPGLLLLQENARALRVLRERTVAVQETDAELAQFFGFNQDPSTLATLAQINTTFEAVDEIVALANSTVTDTLQAVLESSQSFLEGLDKVQTTAETMKIVLGEEAVDSVVTLVEKLRDVLTPVSDDLQANSDKIQSTLQKILATWSTEREKVYGAFADAASMVAGLNADSGATALIQQGQVEGLPGWLRGLFGGGSRTPCQKALAAVKKANGTVTEVNDKLAGLNTTMCSSVLDGALESATSGLEKAKADFDTAMALAGSQLPESIVGGLKQAAESLFTMSDKLTASVHEQEAKVTDMVVQAQSEASSLSAVTADLAAATDSTCNKASDAM
eukprot:CAMPEP_0170611884 /NCGR_PEP_ID=MMETSP0224-20130122/23428_1 /TAXON_ID=285029 /ORGANISM="Togula jolla, Strain CCCM 725" /LENGTH=365 /DNA_ID=CAMNT_0010937351 /DNA_START=133 /DNA_END=1230 /DNA_ORIENTATION=+